MQKSSGAYYTPDVLADFVVARSAATFPSGKTINVLEPSSGEGAFINSIRRRSDERRFLIDAVEVSAEAIKNSKPATVKPSTVFFNSDFLFYEPQHKYDLAIGNPPFIKKKLLKEEQIIQCKKLHAEAGLKDRAINNIWTSFLVKSAKHLKPEGVLAFVLPAELLQVKFAAEIQSFLRENFHRVEIFTFKEIVFPNIGQDTVALIAHKSRNLEAGVYFAEVDDLSNISAKGPDLVKSNIAERNEIKWSGHIIPEDEIEFLLTVCQRLNPVSHYCVSGAGIVTGANNFFIVNEDLRNQFGLHDISRPIIQRGQFVNRGAVFTKPAFKKIAKSGKPCYLLDFSGKPTSAFTVGEAEYIKNGEDRKLDKRFKCKIRDRWFDVPSIWSASAFFFKRCHLYPKLFKNTAPVLITDSAYRITMKTGYNVNSFVFSFYNSLTLALAELRGRFYGGGVLELTPNEFKSLSIPYISITAEEFKVFKSTFEAEDAIDNILKDNDRTILEENLGLSSKDVKRIQVIRKSLLERRLRHK